MKPAIVIWLAIAGFVLGLLCGWAGGRFVDQRPRYTLYPTQSPRVWIKVDHESGIASAVELADPVFLDGEQRPILKADDVQPRL